MPTRLGITDKVLAVLSSKIRKNTLGKNINKAANNKLHLCHLF